MIETNIIFNLLRSSIDGSEPYLGSEPTDTHRWWSIFRLMQKNHVAGMAAEALSRLPQEMQPSREVLIPWLAEREKIEARFRHQLEVQQDIVSTMKSHGIDTLVLKGTRLASLYPTPECREFGDLDLYFYDKHGEADRVAREVLKADVSNDAHHHSKYDYRGITVESHYDFINTHYPPSNRRYEALLKELAPSPTFDVLFLLRHMACHFAASRITLRDLVDWTLTCRALNDKVDWSKVQDIVSEYGMSSFASALSLVAEHQLGILLPLQRSNSPDDMANRASIERDIVYGSVDDHAADGIGRLGWKFQRWNALAWKRRMVYSDSPMTLCFSSITSHAEKPRSILHKQ